MGAWKHCSTCGNLLRDKQQSFFLEESTYWRYSDGKKIPSVEHHYFCSKKCIAEWATKPKELTPPDDLNDWVDGRKISSEV